MTVYHFWQKMVEEEHNFKLVGTDGVGSVYVLYFWTSVSAGLVTARSQVEAKNNYRTKKIISWF